MSYPKELDEFSDVELIGEIDRRKAARAAGLCDYCNRMVTEPSCRFPLRHRSETKISAPGQGSDSGATAYKEATVRLAKCVGFWLLEQPDGVTETSACASSELDARAEKWAPGFSGGMFGAGVREALRRRDDGTLRAWLGVSP